MWFLLFCIARWAVLKNICLLILILSVARFLVWIERNGLKVVIIFKESEPFYLIRVGLVAKLAAHLGMSGCETGGLKLKGLLLFAGRSLGFA